jgi:hypothetical protein
VTAPSSTPVLDLLRAVPSGFGQPSFAAFSAALVDAARAQAAAAGPPPTLLVLGEPLAGKSTFLSQLFVRLTGSGSSSPNPSPSQGRGEQENGLPPLRADTGIRRSRGAPSFVEEGGWGGEVSPIRPYLVRWGDTIRAGKKHGQVAPERQFGDLTPDEFARVSALLADAATAALQDAQGGPPAIVVVEAPGVTMFTDSAGQTHGLDRGYSLARKLARQENGFLLALCADQQVREAHLATRHAQLTTGGPDVREATQLAANRIRQQVTDLLYDLATEGRIALPEPAPVAPLTRESLDFYSAYRSEAVLRAYLPYLFEHDLGVPAERAFIGLNGFIGEGVAPDLALLDAYDWTHPHFGI